MALARKWDVKKWVESDGRVRWYGCRGDHIQDKPSSCSRKKGLAVPPCDLENLADAIKFVMRECENARVYCELHEGSMLGESVHQSISQSVSQSVNQSINQSINHSLNQLINQSIINFNSMLCFIS